MLLRVPGIGVTSARRICAARRSAWLSYDTLRRLGIVLKRAKYFITCRGRFLRRVGSAGLHPQPTLRRGAGRRDMSRWIYLQESTHDLCYDGSFFGYLSAVFDAWHDGLQHTEDIRCDGGGRFIRLSAICAGRWRKSEAHPGRIAGPVRRKDVPFPVLPPFWRNNRSGEMKLLAVYPAGLPAEGGVSAASERACRLGSPPVGPQDGKRAA